MTKLYLAFYKGRGGIFSKAIRWWTRSQFSHVELVSRSHKTQGHYDCWSSYEGDGGVRLKTMALSEHSWTLVPVHVRRPSLALSWFENNRGCRYDWLGIFGMAWSPWGDVSDRYFCSEACLTALQEAGWGVGLIPGKTSPGALHHYAVAQIRITR